MDDPMEVFEQLKAGDVILFEDQFGQHIAQVTGRSPKGLLMVRQGRDRAPRSIRPDQIVRQIAA